MHVTKLAAEKFLNKLICCILWHVYFYFGALGWFCVIKRFKFDFEISFRIILKDLRLKPWFEFAYLKPWFEFAYLNQFSKVSNLKNIQKSVLNLSSFEFSSNLV
jgi:hypothetical protein